MILAWASPFKLLLEGQSIILGGCLLSLIGFIVL